MSSNLARAFAVVLAACMLCLAPSAWGQISFIASTSGSATREALVFVAAGTPDGTTGDNATINPGIPAGTVENDLLIALVFLQSQTTVTSVTAGWNLLASDTTSTTTNRPYIYWKYANATQPETAPQFRQGAIGGLGANLFGGQIFAFRGAQRHTPASVATPPTPPFDGAHSLTYNSALNFTTQAGAISTATANAMLLFAAFMADDHTEITAPQPGGTANWSSAITASSPGPPAIAACVPGNSTATANGCIIASDLGNDASLALWYGTRPTAGAQAAQTATRGGASGAVSHGAQISLRPPLTLNRPAGTATNDVMIAAIAVRPNTVSTITPPSGWTLLSNATSPVNQTGGTTERLWIYWKVATASEPAQYTWRLSGATSSGLVGSIATFRGIDTSNPIINFAGNLTSDSLSHPTAAAGIATTVANAMVVTHHIFTSSGNWSGAPTDPVAPTGTMSTAANAAIYSPTGANSDGGISMGVFYRIQASAANTGVRTASVAGPDPGIGATHILALRPAVTLAHYSILPSSTVAATCEEVQYTISGHDSSHTLVNPPSGTVMSIRAHLSALPASTTGVWIDVVGGAPGVLSGHGANNGLATFTWNGTSSSVTLRYRKTSAAIINVDVNDGARTEPVAIDHDPNVEFRSAVFRFRDSANGPINTHVAGKRSDLGWNAETLVLDAIRTDTASGTCTSLFTGSVNVQVGYECRNPTACTGAAGNLQFNGTALSTGANANGTISASTGNYQTLSLTFGANAASTFTFMYPDAGMLRLHARYTLPTPPTPADTVYGASNDFIVKPFGLRISGVPSGTNEASSVLAAAGATFPVTVTAVAWATGFDTTPQDGHPDSEAQLSGPTTLKFGTESSAATVTLTPVLNLPSGGTLGSIGNNPVSGFASGVRTQSMTYSEVGTMNLKAASSAYLGGVDEVRGSPNGVLSVGRFRPNHFVLSNAGTLAQACPSGTAFSYMGQAFSFTGLTLQAHRLGGGVTQNYTGTFGAAGSFVKLNPVSFAAYNFAARDFAGGGTALTTRIDSGAAITGTWASGQLALGIGTFAIKRASPDNPDGPYTQALIGMAPADSDGVALLPADLDLATTGGSADRKRIGGATDARLRFGRLRCQGAFGSDKNSLPMQLTVQRWNGTAFETNSDDTCTALVAGNIGYSNFRNNLAAGEVGAPTVSSMSAGQATITLPRPAGGDGNYLGGLDVTVNLSGAGRSYLLGNWSTANPDADATTTYDDNPVCGATFGVFGSEPRNLIFRRENY